MPLSIDKKNHVLEKINSIEKNKLSEALIEAARNGIQLPIIGRTSPLKEYINAFEASKHLIEFSELQFHIITKYINERGVNSFKDIFLHIDSPKVESFSDEFLEYFADYFNWPLTVEPYVELTIKRGKVYWKITKEGRNPLYDNTKNKADDGSNLFSKEKTIRMNWDNFKKFKDAGKRTSNVAITKDRFWKECSKITPEKQHEIVKDYIGNKSLVDNIWDELKSKGFLDRNNRLTHFWYSYAGTFALDSIENVISGLRYKKDKKIVAFLYPYIGQVLNNAAINEDYSKVFIKDKFNTFRPARTVKNWAASSRAIKFSQKSSHPVQQWDVGSFLELQKNEVVGDNLEHDHIPSKVQMKQDITTQYNNGVIDNQIYEIAIMCKDEWGAIEVTKKQHHAGETHSTDIQTQLKEKLPFYTDFEYYLNDLFSTNQNPQYLIEVIGAFRYLFSCHIKEKFTAQSGCRGYFFNNSEEATFVDNLLLEKLSEASAKL